jgi:uncharacterized protein (TIGR03083 family)
VSTATDVPELVRVKRMALLDLLETCDPGQWATPSLCEGWTVQDVAAHLAWAPVVSMAEATTALVRSRFRLNRFIADSARRWSDRGTEAILAQLRSTAVSGAKPMGVPDLAALGDAVVHGLDIRRPLHDSRRVPAPALRQVVAFFTGAGARWPLTIPVGGSVHRRIAGLRLVADDLDWSHGHGPEVHGTGASLVLVLTGRSVGPDELTGPGAAELYARL